jgi:hypothetical protein
MKQTLRILKEEVNFDPPTPDFENSWNRTGNVNMNKGSLSSVSFVWSALESAGK